MLCLFLSSIPGAQEPFPSARLSGTPAERYTQVLEGWVRASRLQLEALEQSDWGQFQAAARYKDELLSAWKQVVVASESPFNGALPTQQRRWEALIQEARTLDRQIEEIVRQLREEVRRRIREFGAERRALRRYHELPREFTPSFFDKKV